IKKGDKVMVIAGKDKGKTGVVSAAFPKTLMDLVEGINMKKKHQKPRRGGQKGQVVEKNFPLHVSNVMIGDPKSDRQTRVSITRKDGKHVRVTVKSKSELV